MIVLNIKNEIKWIKEYRFPIKRNYSSLYIQTKEILTEYISNIENCSFLKKDIQQKIINFTESIINTACAIENESKCEAKDIFFNALDEISDYFPMRGLYRSKDGISVLNNFFRVNRCENFEYNKISMLHIPFSKKDLVSENRYNIAGQPCMYASTDAVLCWYETNMPTDFYIQKYTCESLDAIDKAVMYMDWNPIRVYSYICNCADDTECIKRAVSILSIWPLMIVCSFIARNKNSNFVEEYKIPQLLTLWIIKSKKVIGIIYRSDSKYDEVRNRGGSNVAIPVKEGDDNGYSRELEMIFGATEEEKPVRIEMAKELSEIISDDIIIIQEFKEKIENAIRHYEYPKVYCDYKNICNIAIINMKALKGECINLRALFTLKSLGHLTDLPNEENIYKSSTGILFNDVEIEKINNNIKEFKDSIVPIICRFINIEGRIMDINVNNCDGME